MTGEPQQEKRRCVRVRLVADVSLQLLIPHETFQPRTVQARTTDLSSRGVGLTTPEVTKAQHGELLRGMSHAKLVVTHPSLSAPLRLSGKVVWSEFREAHPGQPAHCCLGITWHPMEEEQQRALDTELEHAIRELAAAREDTPPA